MTTARTSRLENPDRGLRLAGAAPALPEAPALTPGRYAAIKLCVEWLAALALLVASVPLLLILATILRSTSRGPVLYSQVRFGRSGKRFTLYKLRTMADGCEVGTGPVWSIADDPRATTFGRWLRATHLDELPQLWNVLRGEMSLIGPRPERPELAAKIERALPEFRDRLAVRPGLTGLAQMLQPADSDIHTVRRKLAHDLRYLRQMGPGLDLRIAAATVLHMAGLVDLGRWLLEDGSSASSAEAVAPTPMLRLTVADSLDSGVADDGGGEDLLEAA
jgi:lipopolysaccharide/colanic/teichoic acid biosynthesis glycosyltransferase